MLWLDCLQKVEDGKIKRLMGLMPPGSGKSNFTSVVFPTHYMGRFANSSVIVASYGSDLPRKFGRRARSIVRQPIYQRIFDTNGSAESSAADEWTLDNGSEWMAAGILTGITGNRVDVVIWDDLIKGREQADSDIIRNKTWDAYFDDLMTRKKPNASEVGIITRWHEDDPAGRILPLNYNGESGWIQGRDGNDWYVVCLPAQCEREDDPLGRKIGEYIWPEWFPPSHFEPFKRNPRTWSALFQQRPAPETGDYFQSDWIKQYERDPATGCPSVKDPATDKWKVKKREEFNIYGASDYAVTKEGGDYTVHIVVGIDERHQIYVLDLWRQQASPDVWIEAFCDLVRKWRPIGWAEEGGQIRSGIGPFLTKRLLERKLYVVRAQFPTRGDKAVRAQSIRGRMAMQGLHLPSNAGWLPDFQNELMAFPNGRHDDCVDALGLIGQVLDKMIGGSGPALEAEKPKVFSTVPGECTVTMDDLWEANEKYRSKGRNLRIA